MQCDEFIQRQLAAVRDLIDASCLIELVGTIQTGAIE